jgi:hypothetical protein
MYSAPLVSITAPTTTDVKSITRTLIPLLRASSSRTPILIEYDSLHEEPMEDLNRILLFTHHGRISVAHYQKAAHRNSRKFIPITLTCAAGRGSGSEDSEPEAEADAEDAAKMDTGVGDSLGYGTEKELVVDVGGMSAEEIAGKIARWVWWVGEFMSWDDEE